MVNIYTPNQVKAVLKEIGIQIVAETYSAYNCYCPLHYNRETPAFSVSKTDGLFYCHNEACNVSGTLIDLVRKLTKKREGEIIRFIAKKGSETNQAFQEDLQRALTETDTFTEWRSDKISEMREAFLSTDRAQEYMKNRGFTRETCDYFEVGYSEPKDMVVVPVHSPDGICIGIVGRSIEGKDFQYSWRMPKHKTLFNLHRAKKIGDIVIVTESTFDTMMCHQAGFPNSVGILGGNISQRGFQLLDRYFKTIINMTDYDDPEKHKLKKCKKCPDPYKCKGHNPGRLTGASIVAALPSKNIEWGVYNDDVVYPHGAKDPCEMPNEIAQCIKNAVGHLEYIERKDHGIQ